MNTDEEAGRSAPADKSGVAVWVADDDRSIRWVLEKALERAGLPARMFASAAEVLEALATDQPRVLVSDIRMPGTSGIDLLQEVKRRAPGLPVIIMTAYSDLESAVSTWRRSFHF